MKKIFYIARNELYSLFYSPIAWILMITFLVMTSSDFVMLYKNFVAGFERGGPDLGWVKDVTFNLMSFTGTRVMGNLYIFFPLITMGLISRETSTGTMRLLFSSPLRIREIVFGKYLAILFFALCLIVLMLIPAFYLLSTIPNADYALVWIIVFAVFLVLATYSAIGLFISSLTSYQIVAAIITLAVFALLGNIGSIAQDVNIVRSLTSYINLTEKTSNTLKGLLNTRDISYFLIIIAVFLAFTIIKIKSSTQSVSSFKKFTRYAVVILVAGGLGYITSRPEWNIYYDATVNQTNTITPPTQNMLSKLNDGPLEVTVYANLFKDFPRFSPIEQLKHESSVWEKYIRFKPDIRINFVYYYAVDSGSFYYSANPGKTLKQIAERESGTYNMSIDDFQDSATISKYVNIKEEEFRCFFELKYKDRKTLLRTFDDMDFVPLEDEIAAAINRLIATPPRILFLSDEIERSPYMKRARDYRGITNNPSFRYSLLNQGYNFDTFSLRNNESIPLDIAAFIIADPRASLAPENLRKIYDYVDAGGNLLITAEPDRREVTEPLLNKLGVSLRKGVLLQPSTTSVADIVYCNMTDTALNFSPQFKKLTTTITKLFGDTTFPMAVYNASALEFSEVDGFKAVPLAYTNSGVSWNRIEPIHPDSLNIKISKIASDESGRFVTSLRLSRLKNGKEQKIYVAGDADFPAFVPADRNQYNFMFSFWMLSTFSNGKFPANTMRPDSMDNTFTVTVKDVPGKKLLLYWIIPGLIAIGSSVLLIRRKRK